MAIDIRNSRKGKVDRCKWYKAVYVENQKLVKDAVCEGVFYADGAKDDKVNRINVTGNFLADNVTLILSTFDYVEGLTVDDYVEIEGELYLVTSVEIKGIARSEHFNRRIAAETLISLRA